MKKGNNLLGHFRANVIGLREIGKRGAGKAVERAEVTGESFGENRTYLGNSKAEDESPKWAASAGIDSSKKIGGGFFSHALQGG